MYPGTTGLLTSLNVKSPVCVSIVTSSSVATVYVSALYLASSAYFALSAARIRSFVTSSVWYVCVTVAVFSDAACAGFTPSYVTVDVTVFVSE